MTSKNDAAAATSAPKPSSAPVRGTKTDVACPFCGILCDDLEIESGAAGLVVRRNGCDKAKAGFERKVAGAAPQIDGKPATLEAAIRAAAGLIGKSRLPLFGGLGTDVEGMRAVMALADRSGGVVDHALSEAQVRNFRVLQSSGWVMSTLTEVRNRADLIIVVGSDIHKIHPRFFERIVTVPETMFEGARKRTIVFLGEGLDASAAKGSTVSEVLTLPCPADQVGDVLAAIRAHLRGAPVNGDTVAGLKVADVNALAERCRSASYGVMVWAPPSLNFPNADLTVQVLSDLVKELNVKGRFAGLSLAGNEGAVTAGAVCAWQSGFPLRVSYASGKPEYDPYRYSIARMAGTDEADLLVWLASFTPDLTPPPTKLPMVVLATPGLKLASTPAVLIPVGTPGADHAGRLVRCDNVVSLPLKDLGRSDLPSAAAVLSAIEAAL